MKHLVIYDLETTGVDKTKDFIIQFAAIKVNRKTDEIIDSLNLYIQPQGAYTIAIPAYLKHHISPDFLKDKPYFFEVADQILDFMRDCDVLTYNGTSFDIPFLKQELLRAGRDYNFLETDCYDAFLEEKRRNGISLENTFKRYNKQTMEEAGLTAHDALSDVKATYSVFKSQQKRKKYGPEEMFGEDNFITASQLDSGDTVACFKIGKYRDVPIAYVATFDQDYLKWCVGPKSSLLPTTKKYINEFIK